MTVQDDYQVRIDAFCGPLDLLLYLIRQAEVDVHEIPIAQITDQYLALLEEADDVDIEAAGEFLVMAATLMEIKSRTLMPPEEQAPLEAEGAEGPVPTGADPRLELVQQLLEYQKYRVSSEALQAGRETFQRQYPASPFLRDPPGAGEEPPALELEDAHPLDLHQAYERIIASIDFDRMGDHHVEIDDTPAAVYQEALLDRLRGAAGGRLTLQDAFEEKTRVQRLGLFLAMLELVRLRLITVRQEDLTSEIAVELAEEKAES